jgi:hypothetical protein
MSVFTISYAPLLVKPPPLAELLPDLKRKTAKELAGSCPFCGGRDRFIVSRLSGRGFCRQCSWKGDSIQLLRDKDGLSFREAVRQLGCDLRSAPAVRRLRAEQRAIAHVKEQYRSWQSQKLDTLFEEFQDIDAQQEIALTAYRQMWRCPELYDQHERSFWTHALSRVYDRSEVLAQEIDFFTLSDYERERFAMWQQEVGREQ